MSSDMTTDVRYFVANRKWWVIVNGVKSPAFDTEQEVADWVFDHSQLEDTEKAIQPSDIPLD